MFSFVKQILYQCDTKVNATAYSYHISMTNIRICPSSMGPISVLSSYLINGIEIIQQRAARWVKQEYGTTISETSILNNLASYFVWMYTSSIVGPPYSLNFFTKIHLLSNYLNIICPSHWLVSYDTQRTQRLANLSHHLQHDVASLLLPEDFIIDWNNQPNDIIDSDTLDYFSNQSIPSSLASLASQILYRRALID